MIKKIIAYIKMHKKKSAFCVGLLLIIVVLIPVPTRCKVIGFPPVLDVALTQGRPTEHICYSVRHKEFWDLHEKSPFEHELRWRMEYHWMIFPLLEEFMWGGNVITQVHLLYPADPANDQILLGASHNVFIGKVLAQTGNKETEIGPRTQYQVQVIDNIKGELGVMVTVDMLGGYDNNGKRVFIEDGSAVGEDPVFQPGSTYLFATRYNAQEDWYTVIAHPNARKVLSTDDSLSVQALRALAEKDEKVKKFEAAYVSEILDKADVANNNTRNNFQSLPPEAKAAAVARADAARASLGVNAE